MKRKRITHNSKKLVFSSRESKKESEIMKIETVKLTKKQLKLRATSINYPHKIRRLNRN